MYDYTTSTDYSTGADAAVIFGAAFFIFLAVYFVFVVAIYVLISFFLSKVFKKASVPAWIAWVPVYNTWKLLQIGGQPGWWALLAFVPVVNIAAAVFMFIAMFHIGKKLGKEDWFILLAIFLAPVWVIWLGADDSKWDESMGAPRLDTPLPEANVPTAAPSAAAPTPAAAPQPPTNNTTPPTNPVI